MPKTGYALVGSADTAGRPWAGPTLSTVLRVVLSVLAGVVVVVTPARTAVAQDGTSSTTSTLPGTGDTIPAPETELSDDRRTATDGTRSLTVSEVRDLDPAGATVTVTGTGYDTAKGIYVAFCKAPVDGEVPSPCGGGAALEGSTGASQWISSNPPPYGRELVLPYGPDGSFIVQVALSPAIGGEVDCLRVQCAVITRNDHLRTSDRSQDIAVPVGFAGTPFPTTTTTTTTTVAPEERADGSGAADGGGGTSPLVWALPAVLVGGLVVGGGFALRRRGSGR